MSGFRAKLPVLEFLGRGRDRDLRGLRMRKEHDAKGDCRDRDSGRRRDCDKWAGILSFRTQG